VSARWVWMKKASVAHAEVLTGADEVPSGVTVCGRDVAEGRETVYQSVSCQRCKRIDSGACAQADARRKAQWADADARREERVESHRRGHFEVYRCRVCGQQVTGGRGGMCLFGSPPHNTVAERVEAVGPAWEAPAT
jgi:endogenous inhibitor of DNA gyrase (YacG/DUF329 family)